MGILQLIASRNFIVVNKEMIKFLGLEEAVLFGELCSEYDYWEKQGEITDGFFYSTIENIEENTALSEHKQRKAIENLKSKNIIETKKMGMPAKRYIKINEEQIFDFFNLKCFKNSVTSCSKIKEQDTENFSINNNIYNIDYINNNKNNNIKEKENIIKEKENIIEIINYLNSKTHKQYRYTTSKTQSLIKARFKEGFNVDDFKKVIDIKTNQWMGTEWEQYLRPETLFGTKFENYLNQNGTIKNRPDWYSDYLDEVKNEKNRRNKNNKNLSQDEMNKIFNDFENI